MDFPVSIPWETLDPEILQKAINSGSNYRTYCDEKSWDISFEIEFLEKEEIIFTLHYKDDKYPEKEVKIYRYDGTNCLVTIDGKSISLVKRDLVVDLTEAVNAIVLK